MKRFLAVAALPLALAPAAVAAPAWQRPVELARGRVYESVVAGSAGGLAVAWSETIGDGCPLASEVGCQRIHATARRADGSFHPPKTLSVDGVHSSEPQAAITPGGELLVAWLRSRAEGYGERTVEVAVGNAATGAFGPATRISSEASSGAPYQLVNNSAGVAALVWGERAPGEPAKLLVSFRSPGGEFGPPAPLLEGRELGGHSVALAPDGRLLLAWVEAGEDADRTLFVRTRLADGTLTEPETLQHVESTLNSASMGSVATAWTSSGERIVVWGSSSATCDYCYSNTVYAAWAGAGAFSPPQPITVSDQSHRELQLVVDDRGRAVAAWARSSADRFEEDDVPDIRVAVREQGGEFADPVSVAGYSPRLTMSGSDAFVLSQVGPAELYRPETTLFGTLAPDDPARRRTTRVTEAVPWINWSAVGGTPARELLAAWVEGTSPPTRLLVAYAPDDSTVPRISRIAPRRRTLVRGRHPLELRFRLSERAQLTLDLRRAGTSHAQRTASLAAGERRIRIRAKSLRRLRPGRYRATLRAIDVAGNTTRSRAIAIRIRKP